MKYDTFSLKQKPNYVDEIDELSQEAWPEFLLHGDATNWESLFDEFADFQILFCGREGDLVAVGHTVPLVWDGTPEDLPETIFEIIARALEAANNEQIPNTISALAVMIGREHRRKGLSKQMIQHMKLMASSKGCEALIAPVRPTLKDQYPLIPMKRYIHWTGPNGEAFDPWLRVHARLGAVIIKVAPCTLMVEGSVSDWEGWTGMAFPDSGEYIVRGALQPVSIDQESGYGCYKDPNVWMRHSIAPRSKLSD